MDRGVEPEPLFTECGIDIDVAYSVRRRSGGLAAAAARADAALDTALARRANAST